MFKPTLITLPTGAVDTPSDAAEPPPPLLDPVVPPVVPVVPPVVVPVLPPVVVPPVVVPVVVVPVPPVVPPVVLLACCWARFLKNCALFTRVPQAPATSAMRTTAMTNAFR